MITIKAVRRADGMLDYTKEGPGYRLQTLVPPIHEKLDAQLAASLVLHENRERFMAEVNASGSAVISFRPIRSAFYCFG